MSYAEQMKSAAELFDDIEASHLKAIKEPMKSKRSASPDKKTPPPATPGGAAAVDEVSRPGTKKESAPKKEKKSAPVPPPSDKPKTRRAVLFLDHASDTVYGGILNDETKQFEPGFLPAPRGSVPSIKQLFTLCGGYFDKEDMHSIRAGEFLFKPGSKEAYLIRADGVAQVNRWREPEVRKHMVASPVCPPTIARVIDHALGNDKTAFERFLNWLAFIYQTHRRSNTAWVLSGGQGTGKGLLFDKVITPTFGPHYCKSLVSQALAGEFNAELDECIFLNVNECSAKAWEGTGVGATVLTLIADETLRVHPKGKDARFVHNYLNLLLFSNKTKITELPPDDRRYNVAPPQLKRLDHAWFPWDYDRVCADVANELPAFCGYLAQYKLDAALAGTAMVNAAKDDMIEDSATSPEQFIHALQKGDLSYFIDSHIEVKDMVHRQEERDNATRLQRTVAVWLEASTKDEAQSVRVGVLCDVYNTIFGGKSPLHVKAFGKFLSNHRMKTSHDRQGSYLLVNFKTPDDIGQARVALGIIPDPFA